MAKGKKQNFSAEELLSQALVQENEQPYEVPANWVWVRLGYLGYTNIGLTYKPSDVSTDGVIVLRSSNIQNGVIDYSDIIKVNVKVPDNKMSQRGDILICARNGSKALVGKTAIIDTDGMSYGAFMAIFRSEYNRLIYHYLNSSYFRDLIDREVGTTTINQITQSIIKELPFPFPPLAEQQRIVDRIESLFAKLDQAKELAQNALDSFKTRKAAILHKAFSGELTAKWREEHGVSMDSWEEKPIESFGDVKGGKRLPKGASLTNEDTGFPYIKAGDLKNGTVQIDKIQYVTPEVQKSIKNYTVTTGDVYITIVGACIGDVGVIPEIMDKANLTENAAKITNLKCDSNYLGLCMSSNIIQDQIKSKIASATLGKLSLQNIKSLVVPMPSLDEQREIVRIINSLFEKENRTKELLNLIDNIDLMKRAILSRAFRGELGTNDPNEESPLDFLKEVILAQ